MTTTEELRATTADINPDAPHVLSGVSREVDRRGQEAEETLTRKPFSLTETKEKISLAEFGLHEYKDFDPGDELRESFEGNLRVIASQIEQYQRTGKPLTQEQKDFLMLYKRLGNRLLDSAEGWSLANLIMEQELFLRLAAIQKDIELEIRKRASPYTPKDEWVIQEGDVFWFEKLLDRYGGGWKGAVVLATAPISVPVIEFDRWIAEKKAKMKPGVKLSLKDFQIDLSRLPREYQDYIKYISPTIATKEAKSFLERVGKARIEFYESLGVSLEDLKAATPWERFRVGSAGAPAEVAKAQENLGTEWMRIRRQALERLSRGVDLSDSSEIAKVFFEAQQKTIRHFLDLHLRELTEARFGVREIAAEREATKGPETISALEKRLNELKSPEGSEEVLAKKQEELEKLQADVVTWQEEITRTQREIDNKKKEQAIAQAKITRLSQQETRYETTLTRLNDQRDRVEQQRDDLIAHYNALINDPNTTAEIKATLISTKNEQLRSFNERISKIQIEINKLNEKLEEVRAQIDRPNELAAEITALEEQIDKLQRKIGRRPNAGARRKIARLQTEIEAGVTPDVQEKIDQLEAVVKCLKDYDRIVSEPVFSATERMLTVQDLISRTEKDEYGVNYNEGYLRILDHLFGYTKVSERKKAFDTARTILPPEEMAKILNARLNLGLAGGDERDLEKVFQAIATDVGDGIISQITFASVFLPILEFIEDKGMKIE